MLRSRSQEGRAVSRRWWSGRLNLVLGILLPGFPEAEEDHWVSAYLALLVPIILVTLPVLSQFGYALPWGFGPGRSIIWLAVGLGLALYFGLRCAWRLREGI